MYSILSNDRVKISRGCGIFKRLLGKTGAKIAYKIDYRCPALHNSTNLYKSKLSYYVTISILSSMLAFSLN